MVSRGSKESQKTANSTRGKGGGKRGNGNNKPDKQGTGTGTGDMGDEGFENEQIQVDPEHAAWYVDMLIRRCVGFLFFGIYPSPFSLLPSLSLSLSHTHTHTYTHTCIYIHIHVHIYT